MAQALFSSSLYPTPTGTGRQNNFSYTQAQAFNTNQFDVKIDFNATGKDHVFGRYSHAKQHNPTVRSFDLLGDSFSDAPIDNEVIDWSHTFSPSLLNDVRFGINYVKLDNGSDFGKLGNLAEQLGITNGNKGGPGMLQLGFYGGTPSSPGDGGPPGNNILSSIGMTVAEATNGRAARAPCAWIARATSSLPVPLSPSMSTEATESAAYAICL